MTKIMEIDAETGSVIERDFTPAELRQRELDRQDAEKRAQELADKAAARHAVLVKLGLTADDLKALGL